MREIWKEVEEAPHYQVSNLGRVRNTLYNYRILSGSLDKDGYVKIMLTTNNGLLHCQVHRLVATAFKKNSKNKPDVNHKNGIKNDNRSSNLEWNTKKENINHSIKTGLKKLKFNLKQVKLIRLLLKNKITGTAIAKRMKCHEATISYIKNNKWKNYKKMR